MSSRATRRRARAPSRAAALAAAWPDLAGEPLAVTIAFDQPEITERQIRLAGRNLSGFRLVIADNSRRPENAAAIEAACRDHGVPYLRLPPNPARQAMRSHGLALNWVARNLGAALQPRRLGFLDHDLVPVLPADPGGALDGQAFYGLLRDDPYYGEKPDRTGGWFLWPGFCFFDMAAVAGYRLNFLPDWFVGLDTGGMNYWRLYRYFDKTALVHAVTEMVDVGGGEEIELIDGCWLHLGKASDYDKHAADRRPLFHAVLERVEMAAPETRGALEQVLRAGVSGA